MPLVLHFEDLTYDWTGDNINWKGNSSLSYDGEFSHQRVSRVDDKTSEQEATIDCLVSESWLNAYMVSIAGVMDLTLDSGPENNFRAKLLNHNCFLAFNANIQQTPVSILNKDFDVSKIFEADNIPAHKMFMPTDIYNGVAMSRVF